MVVQRIKPGLRLNGLSRAGPWLFRARAPGHWQPETAGTQSWSVSARDSDRGFASRRRARASAPTLSTVRVPVPWLLPSPRRRPGHTASSRTVGGLARIRPDGGLGHVTGGGHNRNPDRRRDARRGRLRPAGDSLVVSRRPPRPGCPPAANGLDDRD